MIRIASIVLGFALFVGLVSPGVAGHGVNHYPSFYPEEVRIDAVSPATAAARLEDNSLHVYIGEKPMFDAAIPSHVKASRTLGSLVVLRFDKASKAFASTASRCAAARNIGARLHALAPDAIFHPYPVTPYHADYLHHLDRIEEAKAAGGEGSSTAATPDVRLEEVSVAGLVGGASPLLGGHLGVPWAKEGWFQAHRLLASSVSETKARRKVEDLFGRLMTGDYAGLVEMANLQRQLIAALTGGCERPVIGYRLSQESLNDEFSAGIENVALDSQRGVNSPIFLRTVKLKDYPWNGTLQLGLERQPAAAWNPIAGFTDAPGRLIWAALGDTALIPFPFNASWIPNRLDFTVTVSPGQSGGIRVPPDTLTPEPGTGALRPAGEWSYASVKVSYDILASPYLDGTRTEFADLIYPFSLLYRWGAKSEPGDSAFDPQLEARLRALGGRVVGFRLVRIEEAPKIIAPDLQIVQRTPVIEVYLRETPGDDHQVAALAPPWSSVPWHLVALMEETVHRGHAAFSRGEARRLGVPWLDLARDRALFAKLVNLIKEFEGKGYRPEALGDLISADEAGHRWRALRTFAENIGHLLVTNGPYRLDKWSSGSVVLKAVREATYPLGFGSYDRYVHPPRAVIREATREAGRIVVTADVEKVVKVARHYETEREPLSRKTSRGVFGVLVVSRYLIVGPKGVVVAADKMKWRQDGRFEIDLPERLAPGPYSVLLAVFLDGNSLLPSTRQVRFEIE